MVRVGSGIVVAAVSLLFAARGLAEPHLAEVPADRRAEAAVHRDAADVLFRMGDIAGAWVELMAASQLAAERAPSTASKEGRDATHDKAVGLPATQAVAHVPPRVIDDELAVVRVAHRAPPRARRVLLPVGGLAPRDAK
jgi:hypothetical protein